MKLTKQQLKQIIKEEIDAMDEQRYWPPRDWKRQQQREFDEMYPDQKPGDAPDDLFHDFIHPPGQTEKEDWAALQRRLKLSAERAQKAKAKAKKKAKQPAHAARTAANLEDIKMHNAPIQGAETDIDRTLDTLRGELGASGRIGKDERGRITYDFDDDVVGIDKRRAALKTRPGMGPGDTVPVPKSKRPKRTRHFEAKYTQQELKQLIQEEIDAILEDHNNQ